MKLCLICNNPFRGARVDAKYCSATCRVRKMRGAKLSTPKPIVVSLGGGDPVLEQWPKEVGPYEGWAVVADTADYETGIDFIGLKRPVKPWDTVVIRAGEKWYDVYKPKSNR